MKKARKKLGRKGGRIKIGKKKRMEERKGLKVQMNVEREEAVKEMGT